METHKTRDQFFRVEKGKGEIVIDGITHKLKSGDAILVPAGASHNLINVGAKSLKGLYHLRSTKSSRPTGPKQEVGRRVVVGAF